MKGFKCRDQRPCVCLDTLGQACAYIDQAELIAVLLTLPYKILHFDY